MLFASHCESVFLHTCAQTIANKVFNLQKYMNMSARAVAPSQPPAARADRADSARAESTDRIDRDVSDTGLAAWMPDIDEGKRKRDKETKDTDEGKRKRDTDTKDEEEDGEPTKKKTCRLPANQEEKNR